MKPEKYLKPIIVFFVLTVAGTTALWILDLLGIVKNVLLSGYTKPQYLGFLAADLFALPLLLISAVGLHRRRLWGYVATQIAMGTWIYTSVGSVVNVLAGGGGDIFVLIWAPVYLSSAVFVVVYTWGIRHHFS